MIFVPDLNKPFVDSSFFLIILTNFNSFFPTQELSDEATTELLLSAQTIVKNFQLKSDEKVSLVHSIHELIQSRSEELNVHSQLAENEIISLQSHASTSTEQAGGGGGGGVGDSSGGEGSSTNEKSSNEFDDGGDGDSPAEIVIEQASSGVKSRKKRKRGQKRADSPPIIYIPGPNEPVYCLCRKISFGNMVCCDNKKCKYEWFHFECVALTAKPKGKWFCPHCRGKRSNQPKKSPKSKP